MARLVTYFGSVVVVRAGQPVPVDLAMALQPEDVVQTRDGRALVRFADSTLVRLGPSTRVVISERRDQRTIDVLAGRLWAFIVRHQDQTTSFRTGGTIAAVRGTELSLGYEGEETNLSVFEGEVHAANAAGSLTVGGGQSAVAGEGRAPTLAVVARPRDAVRWALYYLPVLNPRPGDLGEGADWQAKTRASIETYRAGDLAKAVEGIAPVADAEIQDRRFFTYRASLMLATGNVERASQDIARALALKADDAGALALQSVVAVVEDRKDEALALGQKAVAADPGSAAARIALSYAQQARFDLEGARSTLREAVRLEPENALAWARLAELESSFGRLHHALSAAKKASSLQPNLARTRTVLGFAYLAQVDIQQAREALQKAIELDPADPLPRLGLGLARIRSGDVAGGRAEIEVAAGLDPGNSLVRSYLGKAYFEENRTGLAEREYDMARKSDPNDPTPWFYDALAKQTMNRPVEALHDLQDAIERNDNRAVYRSRLMLDSDLAARSASLGRVYSDLGFQSLALVEGWNSVNTDPANHSAHRLLADSYAALPRHEISRVSELFQSQMLQPSNTTPIQPQLAESNLSQVSTEGPAGLSFNEFSPLFNRDQLAVQASGLIAGQDTRSGEGIVSGVYKKASVSAGYTRFHSHGFRVNDGQDDEIANGFAQLELSPRTSVQGEIRHRDTETGDLRLRFLEDDFRPEVTENTQSTTYRGGLKHTLSPRATVLLSYMHQTKDVLFHDGADPVAAVLSFDIDRAETADSVEAQLLFRAAFSPEKGRLLRSINFTSGAGYFRIHSDETDTLELDLPPPPDGPGPLIAVRDAVAKHADVYSYANLALGGNVSMTLGASADFFEEVGEGAIGKRNQVNPKGGVTWKPAPGTTFRAAVLRTLKRTLITDQTLEPTQVAGFTQFFDDPSSARVWVYGAAVDQKISDSFFGGIEGSKRDLEFTSITFDELGQVLSEVPAKEHTARAYLVATPANWLALRAEYGYERLRQSQAGEIGWPYETITTHLVPFGARIFHRSGIGAALGGTYLHQSGTFALRESPHEFPPGSRDFCVLDAALRYRLPKRHGFLSIGVNNLTDERSTYFATDSKNPAVHPGRTVFANATLALP